MARAYIIGRLSVTDPERFERYVAAAGAAIAHHGCKVLVRGGRCETLEGEGRPRNVVLEFESYELARHYYFSPEYQAAMRHRIGIAVADLALVEGV
ncbi:DUF1330 domain-containing protein [Massilia rhizosphaerae]|uniref:DUF1330 domain-containing protein n=1 Tax=Massilia rhizosphaerae TaxID=2784389 RepID=UPI0018DB217A|nr:DUF1330 domain-containing protein [Massilia rhizosphaerae]